MAVAADGDVDESEARSFVDDLVARQLLVSDLAPTLTGAEPNFTMIVLPEGTSWYSLGAARSSTTRVTGGLDSNRPARTAFIPP